VADRFLAGGSPPSRRVTLSDGRLTHDAELNSHTSWRFSLAAYKLSRMLGIDGMLPVCAFRRVDGGPAAVTWWVDGVMMDEGERVKKGMRAPDGEDWNRRMGIVRVFDRLISNANRNVSNLLITRDWKVKMIGHTHAFSSVSQVPRHLTRCERGLFEAVRKLDEPGLRLGLGDCLTAGEIRGLLERRNHIVRIIEEERARNGDGAVLYDLNVR
jgi:hypothetical protein